MAVQRSSPSLRSASCLHHIRHVINFTLLVILTHTSLLHTVLALREPSTRVTPSDRSNVRRFVGNGAMGYAGDGGPGYLGAVRGPQSIVVTADGKSTMYFVDAGNEVIRSVSRAPQYTLATVAGPGTVVFNETHTAPVATALLTRPHSLVHRSRTNTLYVSQPTLNRIAVFNLRSGLAYVEVNASHPLRNPTCLVLDPHSRGGEEGVYICDSGNAVVRYYNFTSRRLRVFAGIAGVAGQGADFVQARASSLFEPRAIAISGDVVFISDFTSDSRSRIRRVRLATSAIDTVQAGTNALVITARGPYLYYASTLTTRLYQVHIASLKRLTLMGDGDTTSRNDVAVARTKVTNITSLFFDEYRFIVGEEAQISSLYTNFTSTPIFITPTPSSTKSKEFSDSLTKSQSFENPSLTMSRSVSVTMPLVPPPTTAPPTPPPVTQDPSILAHLYTTLFGDVAFEPYLLNFNESVLLALEEAARSDIATILGVPAASIRVGLPAVAPLQGVWQAEVSFSVIKRTLASAPSHRLEDFFLNRQNASKVTEMLRRVSTTTTSYYLSSRSLRTSAVPMYNTRVGTSAFSAGDETGLSLLSMVSKAVATTNSNNITMIPILTKGEQLVYQQCRTSNVIFTGTPVPRVVERRQLSWYWWLLLLALVPVAVLFISCFVLGRRRGKKWSPAVAAGTSVVAAKAKSRHNSMNMMPSEPTAIVQIENGEQAGGSSRRDQHHHHHHHRNPILEVVRFQN
eukprot:PhM_4_TR4264/c0_g1_i1/m.87264